MRDGRRFLLAPLAALFFFLAAWFGRPVGGLWNSPDETANAFWAKRVAVGLPLEVRDVMIGLGAGAIHPRSMAVSGDALVPGSFPGLILVFGALHSILRLPFVAITPLFTSLAGLAFGGLVSRLFDRRTGFWAAVLFFMHPAVLYYGARGLFHNELCLDLLILSAASFTLRPGARWFGQGGHLDDLLGGFLFGWAIVTRASEAAWAIPAFLAFLPFVGKDRWRRFATALCGAAVPAFIFLFLNAGLYGSPFRTAYVAPAASSASVAASGARLAPPSLPFGFHPRSILTHLWTYGFSLFWWQTLLAAAGFAWWALAFRKADVKQKAYALAAIVTAAWLAVFYGSWQVMDRFDPSAVTIGTSYVRYFLPAYVAAIPFAALALVRIADAARRPQVAGALAALLALLSIRSAVFTGDESLLAVRSTLGGNAVKKTVLLQAIPPDAVVMTGRFDKLLVPERLRIIPATDASSFAAAATSLTYGLPVYWYGLVPSDAELRMFSATAAEKGLRLGVPASPIAGEVLYPIFKTRP